MIAPKRVKRARLGKRCRASGCRTRTHWIFDVGNAVHVHLCDAHCSAMVELKPHRQPAQAAEVGSL